MVEILPKAVSKNSDGFYSAFLECNSAFKKIGLSPVFENCLHCKSSAMMNAHVPGLLHAAKLGVGRFNTSQIV